MEGKPMSATVGELTGAERSHEAGLTRERLKSAHWELKQLEQKPLGQRSPDWPRKIARQQEHIETLKARLEELDASPAELPANGVTDLKTRIEALSERIAAHHLRIDKLTARRQAEAGLAHPDHARIETTLVRLRAELAPLEAELAAIVAEEDARKAAAEAAAEEVRAKRDAELEAQLPRLKAEKTRAFLAVERATGVLEHALADAISADRAFVRVMEKLGLPFPRRERNRIGWYIEAQVGDLVAIERAVGSPLGNPDTPLVDPGEIPRVSGAAARRECAICQHPERAAIEEAAGTGGQPLRDAAYAFEVGSDVLRRHVATHKAGADGGA
jgi:predicted  nucleic acid-binding Zn-ribbon protein